MEQDNGMGMLNNKNIGPMNKVIKEETHHNEEISHPVAEPCDKPTTSSGCTPTLAQGPVSAPPCRPVVKQEKEPHETHSFTWSCGDKKPTTVTCSKARTVADALKSSSQFNEIARKNKNKELVIVRDGKAISSHFPCRLIRKEHLTLRYIKALDKLKQTDETCGTALPKKRPSDRLVIFHVLTKGGKNVVQIMRNPELKNAFQEMTIYAYEGEKVKRALKRDGRLMNTVFKKNCALSNTRTEETTEMSSLVDDLNGKTFKIILLNKNNPPDSQPSSLDDAYMMPSEFQRSDSDGNQDPPHESTKTESGNDENPKENPKQDVKKAPQITLREIPNSEQMLSHLSSQLKDCMKEMKTQQESKPSRIQNLFRVEYGKNDQTCREVKTMKELMKLSDSVCQVRVNGSPEGSGFLLFDKFVLTNGHVVANICQSTRQMIKQVTVHFSFESLDQKTKGAEVVEVVGYEYCCESGQEKDWALLRFETDQTLPEGLLTHFGFLPQHGGICIIGHPYGGVKKIDPCWIVPNDKRSQEVERHRRKNHNGVVPENYNESQGPIQLITHQFFDNVAGSVVTNRPVLTYKSCFYYGSSGSPVFDAHCNVVAMHTGGYVYNNARAEMSSVIEFGHPLSVIIEHIIIQMVDRGRFDVLQKYLACEYKHQRDVMQKLGERPDLRAFRNAAEHPVVTSDESLKEFFEFFFQREEPVPMDTD